MLRFLIVLTCSAALMVACTDRQAQQPASDAPRVAQAVADAQAGLDAVQSTAMDPAAAQILGGVREFNLAAAGKTPLPQPAMTPAQIVAQPTAYSNAAISTRQHADGSWWKVLATVGITTLTGVAAAAASFVPGVGPYVEPLAKMLGSVHWFGLGSKDQKDADRRQAEMAGQAQTLADEIAQVIPDYRTRLSLAANAALNAVLANKA